MVCTVSSIAMDENGAHYTDDTLENFVMEGMNKDLATEIAEFKGYGTPSTTASDSTSNVSDSSPVYRIIEKGQNFGERYMYATKMPDGEKKRKFLPLSHMPAPPVIPTPKPNGPRINTECKTLCNVMASAAGDV